MEVNKYAPIIVFNYNRPTHSQQTWEALARNVIASESELYLYCDGPRKSSVDDTINVPKVHQLARQFAEHAKEKRLFRNVHVVCSSHNKGLAASIIDGVTDVIEKNGKVIVVEDDLVTSPFFLTYMNNTLDFYEHHPAVFCISANRPPVHKMRIPKDYEYDVFVSLMAFSTGWGTWKNRWESVDWSMNYLKEFMSHPYQVKAFNRGGEIMSELLLRQNQGKIDSWAIRFNYAMFSQHSVAILPCVPYVDNIGFDGSGIHSGYNALDFRNDLSLSIEKPRLLDVIYEDDRIINAFASYYSTKRRPIWKRCVNAVYRLMRRPIPFELKIKVYE